MENCPKCGSRLVESNICMMRKNIDVVVVGKELFCPNMRCDFEEEVPGYAGKASY